MKQTKLKIKGLGIALVISCLFMSMDTLDALQQQTAEELFEAAVFKKDADGDLEGAIKIFNSILSQFPENKQIAAKAQLNIGLCYEKLGRQNVAQALQAFQKVIDNYPEQSEAVKAAKEKLSLLLRTKAVAKKVDLDLKIQKVWSDRVTEILGGVSSDGHYLSFTDWMTGDLAIRDLTTGKNRRLTKKGSWMKSQEHSLFSIISPDDKQVAYNWYNPEGERYDLHLIRLEEPKSSILLSSEDYVYVQPFDWHPDGKQILVGFFGKEGKLEIGFLSIVDGSKQTVKTFKKKYDITNPPWNFVVSPDGSTIAYDDDYELNLNNRDIFLLSVNGEHEQRIVDHPSFDYVLDWTADGKYLLFGSERTGFRGAWIVQVEEGKALGPPRLVKPGIGPAYAIGCTQENQFYYGITNQVDDVYITEIDPASGAVSTEPKIEIRHYEGHNAYPDYSSDGEYLAYTSLRNTLPMGSNAICIYSLKNGDLRELHPGSGHYGYPQWRPDGKSISLEGTDDKERKGIYLLEIESEELSPLVKIEENEEIFAHRWSMDGNILFYTKRELPTGICKIYTHDLKTGLSQVLPGSPDDANDIDVSPDGNYLVFINRNKKRSLRIMPIKGGEFQELYSFETRGASIITPAWSPDGKYIFFPVPADEVKTGEEGMRPGAQDDWVMCRISLEDKQIQNLDLHMKQFRHLSFHPEGGHLAFSSSGRGLRFNEIWRMENFLPKLKENR